MGGLGPGRSLMMVTAGGMGFENGLGKRGGWRGDCALPEKPASPKSKTPASWPTSQYPSPSGVRAMATIGSFKAMLPVDPQNWASP